MVETAGFGVEPCCLQPYREEASRRPKLPELKSGAWESDEVNSVAPTPTLRQDYYNAFSAARHPGITPATPLAFSFPLTQT
jgi:hypothetical protein